MVELLVITNLFIFTINFLNFFIDLQTLYQLAGLGLTIGIAIVGGLVTGLILRIPIIDQVKYNQEMFEDHLFWETPSDYSLTAVADVNEIDK